jgi:sigma-B regulation protein RsbU (phosphoserine phosphatase)
MSDRAGNGRRLGFGSFRAKFVLVVGGAVLFDLLVSGGLALWNVRQLSNDATEEVGRGLKRANEDYIHSYADATAARVNLVLDQVDANVRALAGVLQTQIDDPAYAGVGSTVSLSHPGSTTVEFNPAGGWAQNAPGATSVVSVWGYLLGADHQPLPAVLDEIKKSAAFDLVAGSFLHSGPPKLQMYFIGPKERPIFRTSPYTDQAQTFDRLYPGHNTQNFWDFFFPKLYESWEGWARLPETRPVSDDITRTAPYTDAITGKLIVSFFHPLWTANRTGVAGAAGADITLDQLAEIVENVKVGQNGFGFLASSDGNVIAVNPAGEKTIGLKMSNDAGKEGVTGLDRSLRKSRQKAISTLDLGRNSILQRIVLDDAGADVPYLVITEKLKPSNLWGTEGVTEEVMSLGIIVPEHEIYASLLAAQDKIKDASNRIVLYQLLAILVSLAIVTAAVLAASKRVTAGITALAGAARRIQDRDYSVRVAISSKDEVGEAGVAFNRMAEEIRYNTENLERLVEDRTHEIEKAKTEITVLNAKLSVENERLGSELAVAKQIQLMVLPREAELADFPAIEMAAYMRPADEVGGDYYDVLKDGSRLKIGIGDVTGHGLESGVLMLMVQSVARALQDAGQTDPSRFLSILNKTIFKNIERTEADKHLTLAFLDYEDGFVTISGQHEDVIIVRRNGGIEKINTIDLGFPIGMQADISAFIDTKKIPFDTGDVIILHTDGVTEAENPAGELFGIERLCEEAARLHLETAEAILQGILKRLIFFIATQKVHDDITLVALKHR